MAASSLSDVPLKSKKPYLYYGNHHKNEKYCGKAKLK